MQVTYTKAPSKMKITKAALFAVFTMAAANSITLEAQAKTAGTALGTPPQQETGQRYIFSTFGGELDTKYCEEENYIEDITEKVCREGDFKYVTPEVLESIAYQESRFISTAQNGSAVTMYQIKPQFHTEALEAAGVTLEDIGADPEAQTAFAAQVIEGYAESWEGRGLAEEDIIKAAVTNYHLAQDTAEDRIKSGSWDSYTEDVLGRAEVILENKEKGRSASVSMEKDLPNPS